LPLANDSHYQGSLGTLTLKQSPVPGEQSKSGRKKFRPLVPQLPDLQKFKERFFLTTQYY
jgi:hypothetical protein